MRALLDVNVLLSLFEPGHVHHRAATEWLLAHGEQGWASCPITQNGFLRIASSPSYPNSLPLAMVIGRLRTATAHPAHEFWPDEVTLLDSRTVDARRIHGSRQVTDAYLLATAVAHHATLVTFDRGIAMSAVMGATPGHLTVL